MKDVMLLEEGDKFLTLTEKGLPVVWMICPHGVPETIDTDLCRICGRPGSEHPMDSDDRSARGDGGWSTKVEQIGLVLHDCATQGAPG